MNYQDMNLKQIVNSVTTANYASVDRMKNYYKKRGNAEVAEKIDTALQIVQYFKLKVKLENLEKELHNALLQYNSCNP